ncbi:MAG: helix-turn-helix domain-containing protein [Alphaproteobacteria bacterium]
MQLITEKEAATLLNCSTHKLQRDRRIGNGLPYYKVGRSVKYRLSDIEAYLEKQRFTSTSEYGGDNA